MPPHPLGSVSPAPLLLPSCHPAPGDTVSHPLMSEQAKNTVGVSEGGGCVHSGTPHRACAALLSVFLLVILDGWKLLEKLKGVATTVPSLGCLGSTLSGAAAGGNLPLGVRCSLGSFLRNHVCYGQYFMHQKIQWLENATQGVGCVASHPAGALQAYLLSFCNLFTMELQFSTELQDLFYLQRHHRLV